MESTDAGAGSIPASSPGVGCNDAVDSKDREARSGRLTYSLSRWRIIWALVLPQLGKQETSASPAVRPGSLSSLTSPGSREFTRRAASVEAAPSRTARARANPYLDDEVGVFSCGILGK